MAEIQSYQPQWAGDFKALNMFWLEKYFVPEPYDVEVLSKPQEYILDKGGEIFFVIEEGRPVGTAALMYNPLNELELTKMAMEESARGKGFANLLMHQCILAAKSRGATELFLYSNTLLTAAIGLYKKFGFTPVPVWESDYQRCNIKMVKKL